MGKSPFLLEKIHYLYVYGQFPDRYVDITAGSPSPAVGKAEASVPQIMKELQAGLNLEVRLTSPGLGRDWIHVPIVGNFGHHYIKKMGWRIYSQ